MKIGACVYLLERQDSGLLKIGYTTQKLGIRVSQIERAKGNPFGEYISVSVSDYIQCESKEIAIYLESFLHKNASSDLKAGREWFDDNSSVWDSVVLDRLGTRESVWGWREVADFITECLNERMKTESDINDWYWFLAKEKFGIQKSDTQV